MARHLISGRWGGLITGKVKNHSEALKDSSKPLILCLFFLVLGIGYQYLPDEDTFLFFLALFSLQFLLYFALVWHGVQNKVPLLAVIITGILVRALILPSDPVLENDYYRYLWDGRVLAHGINPYLYPPVAPELDFLATNYRELIGWSEIRTIYPPFTQLFFAALHLLAPDSLLGLKIGLVTVELLAGALLVWMMPGRTHKSLVAVLYFLNPLLLKEVANSAHLDALPMCLTVAAVAAFMKCKRYHGVAWILLALSVAAKNYPLLLVPLFFKLDERRFQHALLFVLTLMVLYVPFLSAGSHLFSGASAFSTYWIFNAGVFKAITLGANTMITALFPSISEAEAALFYLRNDYPAKAIVGVLTLGFVAYRTVRLERVSDLPRETLYVLGAVLLLSPVVNAWYVLWLLPFACLERSVPWIAFTFLVVASYSWFWSEEYAYSFRLAEYAVLYLLLLLQFLRKKKIRDSAVV